MLPHQLREAIAQSLIAFVPLGTLEWHCEHLPVGLDALTAHGLCLRAAEKVGGVVLPPLHYGTGGDHGAYPFTIMAPAAQPIEQLLALTLRRLKDFGFRRVLLLSGHFPDTQLEMIDRLAATWGAKDFEVIATAVNRFQGLPLPPDHAGEFETALLYALHPDLVHMERLPPLAEVPVMTDDWQASRHEPQHAIWGVVGADPRRFDPACAAPLLEAAVAALAGLLRS